MIGGGLAQANLRSTIRQPHRSLPIQLIRPLLALALLSLSLLVACGGQEEAEPERRTEPRTSVSGTPARDRADDDSTAEDSTAEGDSPDPGAAEADIESDGETPTPKPRAGTVTVERLVRPGSEKATAPKRWLGISVANMADPIAGAPEQRRAMIQRTFRGGPAHHAGLRRGDVIVASNGVEVLRYQDYLAQARAMAIGDTMELGLLRDGQPLQASLVMIEKPADAKRWRQKHFPGTEAFAWEAASLRPAGGRVDSSQAAGRPQLLYFWATWCGPCRTTSPMIEALYEDHRNALHILAVSSEQRDMIEAFLDKSSRTYPVARDEEGMMKLDYEVKSLPTIVLIDGRGSVVAWDYGIGGVRRAVARARDLVRTTPKEEP